MLAPAPRLLTADGFLGIVYLDLYRRTHKFPGAGHFTLRCGRELGGGSSSNAASGSSSDSYQTPVVALVANMAPHSGLAMGEVSWTAPVLCSMAACWADASLS